jgi:hypothetical protein
VSVHRASWTAAVRFPAEARDFSLPHCVQTGPGTHTASYTMGLWVLSPEVKRPGREADYTLPSSAEVKNGGAIPALPISLHGVVLN